MAVADELRQDLTADSINKALAIQSRQVSSSDARAGSVWPTEKKTPAKPSAHRSSLAAADTGDISSSMGGLGIIFDVGNSQYVSMVAELSVASATVQIALALYDASGTLIGITEVASFIADASWRNGASGPYVSPRYVFDVSGASKVLAKLKSISSGNVGIYLISL